MNILSELNEDQIKPVQCTEGPVMVVAGPGSGKTRVLTYRIAHLLQQGIDPFHILSLTFTNKAAREMRERIEKLIGSIEARGLWAGTFHSVFSRILRVESDEIGYPSNFTIYDTTDAKNVVKGIIKELNLDNKIYGHDAIYARISKMKNLLILPEQYLENENLQQEDEIRRKPQTGMIYREYCNRCFRSAAMDFDDLLLNTYLLFERNAEAIAKYQSKFQYVLVDEFQDTNPVQYMIVKTIAAIHKNLCVVGDDAQSIYAFRGATIQNILNFRSDYNDANVFKLEKNYRSTQTIVNAANSVISNNKKQISKQIWTANEEGEKIKVLCALTDNEEGMMVAHSIFEEKNNRQLPNKNFAIFYRTNAQSRAIEEALRKYNTPYRIFGGISFYQRKEIKDMLAYFNLAINNRNEEALKRVINYPARGIGETTINRLNVAAGENKCSLWEVIENQKKINLHIPSETMKKLSGFTGMIRSFSIQLPNVNAYDLAFEVATSSGILKELYSDQTPEGISRYENIQELLNGIKDFSETPIEGKPFRTLDEYLHDIALLTDADQDPENSDYVSLMTLHSAKGLEFPYVYIVGLEENLFPSGFSVHSREEVEEERRLFYVGITRAGRKLHLAFAQSRYRFGTLVFNEPSRFLFEVDKNYLQLPSHFNSGFGPSAVEPEVLDFHQMERPNRFKKPVRSQRTSVTPKSGLIHSPDEPNVFSGRKLKRIATVLPAPSVSTDAFDIRQGMDVEHIQFGKGKVTAIEGTQPNVKATIHFDGIGSKILLLRFARLKVLQPEETRT